MDLEIYEADSLFWSWEPSWLNMSPATLGFIFQSTGLETDLEQSQDIMETKGSWVLGPFQSWDRGRPCGLP